MPRLIDLVIAALLLVIAAPVLAIVALLVAIEIRQPPIYVSVRVGRHARLFGMFRLRTMRAGTDPATGRHELRLTRIGRIIRDVSLDDLPGLINVLLGDMSIVGPRPMEPERVDPADPRWRQILSVRPGLISFAILALARRYNTADLHTRRQLELRYVEQRSLAFDLRMIREALHDLRASQGNIKARGQPHRDL